VAGASPVAAAAAASGAVLTISLSALLGWAGRRIGATVGVEPLPDGGTEDGGGGGGGLGAWYGPASPAAGPPFDPEAGRGGPSSSSSSSSASKGKAPATPLPPGTKRPGELAMASIPSPPRSDAGSAVSLSPAGTPRAGAGSGGGGGPRQDAALLPRSASSALSAGAASLAATYSSIMGAGSEDAAAAAAVAAAYAAEGTGASAGGHQATGSAPTPAAQGDRVPAYRAPPVALAGRPPPPPPPPPVWPQYDLT
jgi:hypothetical protein